MSMRMRRRKNSPLRTVRHWFSFTMQQRLDFLVWYMIFTFRASKDILQTQLFLTGKDFWSSATMEAVHRGAWPVSNDACGSSATRTGDRCGTHRQSRVGNPVWSSWLSKIKRDCFRRDWALDYGLEYIPWSPETFAEGADSSTSSRGMDCSFGWGQICVCKLLNMSECSYFSDRNAKQ